MHHGHLILARETAETLELDSVIFIPTALSPHKIESAPTLPALRCAMLEAAIRGEPRFSVDDLEQRRPPPSYTIDTVEELRRRDRDAEFFLFIGQDQLARLESWHRFPDLQKNVQLVVLDRTETTTEHPYISIKRHIDISATDIRNRVATGRSIRYLVPEAVESIIRERQLYRE